MTKEEALQIFRDTGALLEGHFVLRSGLRSRQFFQCALALEQMPIVEKLGAALAEKLRSLGATTVVAPAMGGRPPYEQIYLPAMASGEFTEVGATGSLRVLRRD